MHSVILSSNVAGAAAPVRQREGSLAGPLLGVIVVAVLLCTHVGSPSPHARPVAFVGLGVLGFGAILGLISAIGGLADKSSNYYGGGRAKAEQFILDLVIVALFVLAALLVWGWLNAPALKRAAKPVAQGYGQPYAGQQQYPGQQAAGQQWPAQGQPESQGQPERGGYSQPPQYQGGWPQPGQSDQGQQGGYLEQPRQGGYPQGQQPQQPQQPQQGGWPQD